MAAFEMSTGFFSHPELLGMTSNVTPRALKTVLAFLTIAALSVSFLVAELVIRYEVDAWPFETPMVIPTYLAPRDATLRWRFSAEDGRNSLGLRNREIGAKNPQ